MRAAALLAFLAVVTAGLAGCSVERPQVAVQGTDPDPPHPLRNSDFSWDPHFPDAGEPVVFTAHVRSSAADDELEQLIWDFGAVQYTDSRPTYTFDQEGAHDVSLRIRTAQAGTWTVERTVEVVGRSDGEPEPAPEPEPEPEGSPNGSTPDPQGNETEPASGDGFLCDGKTVDEPYRTHGEAETAAGDLVWAVLKTGFRFVAVLDADDGVLEYTVDGGAWQTAEPLVPDTTRVFILDGLPERKTLCFRVQGTDDVHAVETVNAMNAYDPDSGTYTINTLSLANELPAQARIEDGTARYGQILWDGTEGHVKSGRNIVLFQDPERHNSGWTTCYITLGILYPNLPPCNQTVDIIYTNDAFPGGAASTYIDAIQDPDRAIWMNWVWQGAAVSLDDTGAVLMHEMGHYAFGAMDLYDGDEACNDPALGLSIMGSDRSASEFDGPAFPCPDAGSIPEYVPSWTLIRERFPMVPAREAIDPGPSDDGGENFVHGFTIIG